MQMSFYQKTGSTIAGTGRLLACSATIFIALGSQWANAESVALAPLETLGSQSKVSRATQTAIGRALAQVPGFELVDAKQVQRALSKKPTLRACDGNAQCLTELGRDTGARYVVYGEIGGLADVAIVYLKVIDVANGKELRSTTMELESKKKPAGARAAAFRLLAPKRYVGRLAAVVDIKGASIYVDGALLAKSPARPLPLPVGTHALRVTHPEFRDFVHFVDIEFDADNRVQIDLQKYPIITSDMARTPKSGDPLAGNIVYQGVESTPWYRRWYTVATFSAVVLVTSAIVAGAIADGLDVDRAIDVNR